MKNSRKWFLIIEALLAGMVFALWIVMLSEKNGEECHKVSVIIPNSEDSQWAAFRYGLKMAAEDQETELFIVSTGEELTLEEERNLIKREMDNGADAVIVQPVPGADTEEMLKRMEKKIPVMLVACTASEDRETSLLPTAEPDHYAMGSALAAELLQDYTGNVAGKRFGIVTEVVSSEAVNNRRRGFQDVLKGTGAEICWSVSGSFAQDGKRSLEDQPGVDFVVALDDSSLTAAGECAAANNLHGALVYGIGDSTEAIYYLDTGIAKCLVVPDGFGMGYQSLTETAKSMGTYFRKSKDRRVSHTVMRREDLFSKKNQEILFTMSQ